MPRGEPGGARRGASCGAAKAAAARRLIPATPAFASWSALVRQQFGSIRGSRSFIDRQQLSALAKELLRQLDAIRGPIAASDPSLALALLWEFLALSRNVLARCDDSNAEMDELFREACHALPPVALAARPEPAALARQVFEAHCHDDDGIVHGLIEKLAESLGPTGLAALRQLFEQLAQQPAAVPPQQEQSRFWTAQSGLRAVAEAMGDVDGYIAQYGERQRRVPRIAAGIAQRLLKVGRAEEALRFLQEGSPERSPWPVLDWEDAQIAALEALGRTDEAQAARWHWFEQTLMETYLRDYLQQLPAFEDGEAEQRAIDFVAARPDLFEALSFLLEWPTGLNRAAQVIVQRHGELNGAHDGLFDAAAERLSADHPLAATLALRCMVDFALTNGCTCQCGAAAGHLHTCQQLSSRISDWGEIPPHEAYLAAIRSTHARKRGFWSKARPLGL
ncbi:DUF6880 family protein [Synechococcus sp. CBW1107]|uniref:DUF6880 family protein n=1 Tax=Synechococcus sp. CBW1107 TaxID=2789857 RepID=UPI002AD3F80D|nr:DUF6880 family protein [Synechococcus sp. CBW1107]